MSVESPDDLKAQGNAALKSGDLESAIGYYTEAIELDDTNHVCVHVASSLLLFLYPAPRATTPPCQHPLASHRPSPDHLPRTPHPLPPATLTPTPTCALPFHSGHITRITRILASLARPLPRRHSTPLAPLRRRRSIVSLLYAAVPLVSLRAPATSPTAAARTS